MTCTHCNEPITPVTMTGVTSWFHTDHDPGLWGWDMQFCTDSKPRTRALPKETP